MPNLRISGIVLRLPPNASIVWWGKILPSTKSFNQVGHYTGGDSKLIRFEYKLEGLLMLPTCSVRSDNVREINEEI